MNEAEKRAFAGQEVGGGPGRMQMTYHAGMTYREWLVGMIASGLAASENIADAVDRADAVIERMYPTKTKPPRSNPPKTRQAVSTDEKTK